jgi:hypothetical protein
MRYANKTKFNDGQNPNMINSNSDYASLRTDRRHKGRSRFFPFIIAVIILALTILPFYFIAIKGVYSWSMKQPAVWQGGLTVIAFVLASFALSAIFQKKAFYIVIALGLLYLSMNGVIIPFLAVYAYFEAIYLIGIGVRSLGKSQASNDVIRNFIAGLCVWGALAIVISLCGYGRFEHMRLLTICLFAVSIWLLRKKHAMPLCVTFKRYFEENTCSHSKIQLLCLILLIYIFLISSAKSNTAIDYDSMWYGLRPEHVLIGEHSFYDNLGLESFVYFYSKLMELFLLPISNLGDYSFITIGNIFIFILLIVAINYYCKDNLQLSGKKRIPILLVFSTIPAVAGIAATAKPDIMGVFLVFCGWFFYMRFLRTKDKESLMFSLLSLLLCTGTKPTFILWGGIVFVAIIVSLIASFIYKRVKGESHDVKEKKAVPKSTYIVAFSGVILTFGVHMRTFLLTGYPTYPSFINTWAKLGFTPNYPYKSSYDDLTFNVPPENITAFFRHIFEYTMDPQQLGGVIMLWTSNTLLCLLVVWLYCKISLKETGTRRLISIHEKFFSIFTFIILLAVMLYFMETMVGAGGNYFILPIIVLSLYVIKSAKRKMFTFVCAALIVTQLPLMFVMHPSWTSGTKPFEMNVVTDNFETEKTNRKLFDYHGYGAIADYFINNQIAGTILGTGIESVGGFVLWRLNATTEFSSDIDRYFGSGIAYQSYDDFADYLDIEKVAGFVITKKDASLFTQYCLQYIEMNGYSQKIEDENGNLYIINDS